MRGKPWVIDISDSLPFINDGHLPYPAVNASMRLSGDRKFFPYWPTYVTKAWTKVLGNYMQA